MSCPWEHLSPSVLGGGANTIGRGNYLPKPNQDASLLIYAYEQRRGPNPENAAARWGSVSRRAGERRALE